MIQNKVIYKAYKYRLYPDADQEIFLHQHFGAVRFVYNRFLALRKKVYEKDNNKEISAGTVDYTDGEGVRPHLFGVGHPSMKSEATKSLA